MAILRNRTGAVRAYSPLSLAFFAVAALVAAAIACPASAFAAVNPQQDDANSWRYENGQLAARQQDASGADAIPAGAGLGAIARLSSENIGLLSGPAWSLTFDGFTDGNGGVVDGVIARGVDVSEWNQDIDWEAVRDDGIKYAIIRVGYGSDYSSQDDKWWERNVSECERLGIPFGVYLYSYAQDAEMAQSEAEHVLRLIDGHDLTYPVYFDMEDASQLRATGYDPDALAEIACTFCDAIEDAGYDVGIYANKYWFDHYLIDECFDAWPRWVAQYNTVCDYDGDYSMWQYSSGGRVAGIDHPTDDFGGRADVNYLYRTSFPDDVDGSDWYVKSGALDYVTIRDYMGNYSGTNYFGPYDSLERGMVATILWRMAGCPASDESYPFWDVSDPDAYYYDAVCWAKEQGIISGYKNTDGSYAHFGPHENVTREQLACMFARYASINDGLDTWSDCTAMNEKAGADQVSGYAHDSMGWAVDTGLIEGVSGNELRPQNSAWRASMAELVRRYSRLYLDSL